MDELLDEMEDYVRQRYGCRSASWRSGDFVAGALMEFRGRHGDGRIGHWTVADVRQFLLDWFPRTVYVEQDLQRDVTDCAAVFFRFMAARRCLTGDSLSELEAACAELQDEFLGSCSNPGQWDPAKARLSRIIAPPPTESQDDSPPRRAAAERQRQRSTSPARAASSA
jgi:hypothetical protein